MPSSPGPDSRRRLRPFFRAGISHATALLIVCLLGAPPLRLRAQAAPAEYEVKAAFLFNFLKFTEWPEESAGGVHAPLTIAVLGRDPFGKTLDQMLADKTVRGRKVVVRRVSSVDEAIACPIIFVGGGNEHRLAELVKALEGRSVLTVGESSGFAQQGGVIALRVEDNKVRFDVNLQAAERARLTLSSQLLKLAHIVNEAPRS
ncbi:MAG TPA: YfiR family protein [Terriglobales bacterium]|nr:YfiR family protein [Terriglobales bacterium]